MNVAQNNTTAEHVAESDVLRQVSGGEWSLGEPSFGWEDGVEKEYVPIYSVVRHDEELLAVAFGATPEEALANAKLMAAAKDMALKIEAQEATIKDMAEALETINMMACYSTEENPDAREKMLLGIGETARAALKKAGAA